MGYYNDVGLCLSKSAIELMEEKLGWESLNLRKQVRRLLASAKKHLVDSESGAQIWYWEVKRWKNLMTTPQKFNSSTGFSMNWMRKITCLFVAGKIYKTMFGMVISGATPLIWNWNGGSYSMKRPKTMFNMSADSHPQRWLSAFGGYYAETATGA